GDSSRIQADMTAEAIYDNPDSFENLIELMLEDNGKIAMRVSRVVEICENYFPEYFNPFAEKTLFKLPNCKTPGVKRNILKIFTRRDLPNNEELRGKTIELCFNWMNSCEEPIAVRVLAMMVLERTALKDQRLIPELMFTIEDILEKEDAMAIQFTGKKISKKLRKLML
ncbi:hypothetical protein ACFLSE_09845, partial [Bacteroidota bacterium]